MRRPLLLAALALAIVGSLVPNAGAESLYRGRGPGIRVEFRVSHGEIYFARVRTVLRCVRDGRHVRRKYGESLGFSSIRAGRFESSFETEEPGYGKEWLLEGAVHPGEITGRFWYRHQYDGRSYCQTKHYRSRGFRHIGQDSLRFWASRRPVHSRVRG